MMPQLLLNKIEILVKLCILIIQISQTKGYKFTNWVFRERSYTNVLWLKHFQNKQENQEFNQMMIIVIINEYIIKMSNLEIFKLQLLTTQDYLKFNAHTSGISQLSYTILAGSAVCMRLKIQKSAYRLIRPFNNPNSSTLVLILKAQNMPTNQIKGSFSLIKQFGDQVTLNRLNLGITNLNNQLLPKIPQATQMYVYVNSSSIFIELIKQIISKEIFVTSVKRQQIYINFSWIKGKQYVKGYGSNSLIQYRKLISENDLGKITNYLKLNIKGIVEEGQEKYSSCLFIPNKTKLTIQKAGHYDLNQVTKIIKLPKLYEILFDYSAYKTLHQLIIDEIQFKPEKKMIILKANSGLGISSFLHRMAQQNDYNFIRINCKYFVSDKQLLQKIKNLDASSSVFIFVKNIQWLVELGNDKNDSQQKMKRIIRLLQQVFFSLNDHSLSSHILVINYKGNAIKLDMTKNASIIKFQLNKQQRIETLIKVIQYYQKQSQIQLMDYQQVVNVAANSLGWVKLSKILKKLDNKKQLKQQKIKTQKVLNEISKIVSMQKVQNIKNISWADVGGLQNAKQQIIQTILLPTKHPEIFDEWIKPRTGLLFYGPPGTGKTLLGKCIANQCKMGFISVKGPQLLNMYIGQSEKNVRDVFQRATASRPCIVFMDQLDALIPKRGQSSDSNQVMDRIVSQLLAQMDKASSNGVFVIGATNRPDLLDPSILRPGRFDKQIYLGITKQKESRIQILKAQTRHIKLKQGFDYQKVIDQVPLNFTGADFYGLTSRSITKAAERFIQLYEKKEKRQDEQVIVTEEDFIQTAKQMKPSVSIQELAHYQKLKQQYK